jgi:CHAT domain-containing protein/Tfp pilus assembly protein PilF
MIHFAQCALIAILPLLPSYPAAQTDPSSPDNIAENLLRVSAPERAALLARLDHSTIDVVEALMALGDKAKLENEYARAAVAYQLVETTARAAGAEALVGAALNGRAETLFRLTELDAAKTVAEESVRIHEERNDPDGLGEAWNWIGNIHYYKGEYPEAREAFGKARVPWTSAGNRRGIARVLNNLGNIEKNLGNQDEAAVYYEQALAVFEDIGERRLAAVVTDNIAAVHGNRGDYAQALQYATRALSISEELGDRTWTAKALDSVGNIYAAQGAYAHALEALHRSVTLRKVLGDQLAIAETENNIGLVHFSQGEYQLAIDAYKRSLRVASQAGVAGGQAPANYINIGAAAWRLGQIDRARANLEEALAQSNRLQMKIRSAESLNILGQIALEQRDTREAEAMFRRALEIREAIHDRAGVAQTLNGLARLALDAGRLDDALELARRSTAFSERYGQNELLWESLTLTGIAYRRLGQTDAARASLSNAVAVIEQLRGEVAGPALGRERFFETKLSPYHELVALSLDGGAEAEALEIAERAKGRLLADMIQSRDAGLSAGITAEERRDEHRLRMALRSLNRRLLDERSRTSPDESRIRALEEERSQARSEYESFQIALYARHRELQRKRGEAAPFAFPQAAPLIEDPSVAVLEYVVTADGTHLFVLTRPDGQVQLESHAIPVGRDRLAALVRRLRDRLATRDLLFAEDARQAYELLLAPAGRALSGKSRWVLVPDGPLWEMPFQALRDGGGRYVIESAAVSYAPSLTVLRDAMGERNPKNAPPTLLAMGKADFGPKSARPAVLMADLLPLPQAEQQVRLLPALYGAERSAIFLGLEATEARFKAEAPRHRILHIASHGLFDESSPLYSSVVLSTKEGEPDEDGLLEAWEIMNLKLDADLVILSACETARGRIASGEGIVGTMWALFAAGAQAAVASQWKVEASSTTELMTAFHQRLARGNARTADALRQATLEVLGNPRYAHPFYWAPFVLVGNPS